MDVQACLNLSCSDIDVLLLFMNYSCEVINNFKNKRKNEKFRITFIKKSHTMFVSTP